MRVFEMIPPRSRIGLGSGRTTSAFIEYLGEQVQRGFVVRGVPTSKGSEELARSWGIPIDTLEPQEPLELTIDGADEVQVNTLDAIKGWGAALVRERIVAAASKKQILLVTKEKLVSRLGERGRLPIAVIPFAAPLVLRQIQELPLPDEWVPTVRGDGEPLVTDDGNWIIDCATKGLDDFHELDRMLREIPGVVDTGCFLGTASVVLVAEEGEVRELHRPE